MLSLNLVEKAIFQIGYFNALPTSKNFSRINDVALRRLNEYGTISRQ
jgi:hypothetical protein